MHVKYFSQVTLFKEHLRTYVYTGNTGMRLLGQIQNWLMSNRPINCKLLGYLFFWTEITCTSSR